MKNSAAQRNENGIIKLKRRYNKDLCRAEMKKMKKTEPLNGPFATIDVLENGALVIIQEQHVNLVNMRSHKLWARTR